MANHQVADWPYDFAISQDERYAIAMTVSATGATGGTYIIDLTPPNYPMHAFSTPGVAFPSGDYVDTNEDRFVAATSIGGPSSWGATYVFQTYAAVPPNMLFSSDFYHDAVDVTTAVAPKDMTVLGLVAHDYLPTELLDLKAGQRWSVIQSAMAPSWIPRGSIQNPPYWTAGTGIYMADCVAATANRGVTIKNDGAPIHGGGSLTGVQGAVGIFELDYPSSGWPKTDIFTPASVPSIPNGAELLHDLAVTPRGAKTVVSGTNVIAIYDNRTGARQVLIQNGSLPTPCFHGLPTCWMTADSVEATNSRAVVIGNAGVHVFHPPTTPPALPNAPADPYGFKVALVDISNAAGVYAIYDIACVGAAAPARACDLAITPNQSRAIIATRAGTMVLDLTAPVAQTPLSPRPAWFAAAPDPLEFDPQFEPYYMAVSDAVACTDSMAVVVGRSRAQIPAQRDGQIWLVDLATKAEVTFTLGLYFVPTDVVITPDGSRAIVRSFRSQYNSSTMVGRITIVDLVTRTVTLDVDSTGTSPNLIQLGNASGRDHVETGNHFAVSGGDNGGSTGWIQVIKL